METKLKKQYLIILIILFNNNFSFSQKLKFCQNNFDVISIKPTYMYEENFYAYSKSVCFFNSRYYCFNYLDYAKRKNKIVAKSTLEFRNDSLIIITKYDKSVYGKEYSYKRYYRCIPNGVVSLSSNSNSDFVVTKDTAIKYNFYNKKPKKKK